MTVLVWSAGLLVIVILGWMLGFLLSKGLSGLTTGFFTEDLSKVGPLTPGGGAFHAIIGTLEQVGIATMIVVPIAILTAVYLHEIKGRLATPVRFIVDAMSGLAEHRRRAPDLHRLGERPRLLRCSRHRPRWSSCAPDRDARVGGEPPHGARFAPRGLARARRAAVARRAHASCCRRHAPGW